VTAGVRRPRDGVEVAEELLLIARRREQERAQRRIDPPRQEVRERRRLVAAREDLERARIAARGRGLDRGRAQGHVGVVEERREPLGPRGAVHAHQRACRGPARVDLALAPQRLELRRLDAVTVI
jgi:hypothetical protein